MPETDRLLTRSEVAAIVGYSQQSIVRWADSGKLKPDEVTPGGHRRWRRSTVDAFVADLKGA